MGVLSEDGVDRVRFFSCGYLNAILAAPMVSTLRVAAVRGVEIREHSGKPGRHRASRVQPP